MPFPLSDTLIGVNFDVRVSWDTAYDRHTWSVGVGECGIQYLLDSRPSSGVPLEVALGDKRRRSACCMIYDSKAQLFPKWTGQYDNPEFYGGKGVSYGLSALTLNVYSDSSLTLLASLRRKVVDSPPMMAVPLCFSRAPQRARGCAAWP